MANPKQFIELAYIETRTYPDEFRPLDFIAEVRVNLGNLVIWKKTYSLKGHSLLEVEEFLIDQIIKEMIFYGIASAKTIIETSNKIQA